MSAIEMTRVSSELNIEKPQDEVSGGFGGIGKWCTLFILFLDQVVIMSKKHISQKMRKGRQFWKETVLIQVVILGFIGYTLTAFSSIDTLKDIYDKHALPPLSAARPWGIFNQKSNGNDQYTIITKRMVYCPNDHAGVQDLMDALVEKYPDLTVEGFATKEDIVSNYQTDLFDTYAALQFTLTDEQIASGTFITSQTEESKVTYDILISPAIWEDKLPAYNYTDFVFNKEGSSSDLYWSMGYLTIQNFVAVYLAKNYDNVPADYTVDTFTQRYPPSTIYQDSQDDSIQAIRYSFWRWIAPPILSVCVFVPILSLLSEIVRERQFRMKDLLDISGLMNASYWFSYSVVMLANCQIAIWVTIGIMSLFNIFNDLRVNPYASMLTAYSVGAAAVGMLFGFVVYRSEYYALPAFMVNSALAVGGCYIAAEYGISVGGKMFLCFLSPSIGVAMGTIVIENHMNRFLGESMNYDWVDEGRNLPSLNQINGMMVLSWGVYMLIVLSMPMTSVTRWFNDQLRAAQGLVDHRAEKDDVKYPCDLEVIPAEAGDVAKTLLKVSKLYHTYPDGTKAVADMTFDIKEGEVLSFLGANGAGKSTTMGMLCGALEVTKGDTWVNGYSITHQRTLARRNLGIAMQQDVIWDDVNVEDHLMMFGRLRGLHGRKLRDDVDAMAISLGFPEKRKALAGTLSGGQKRRLCVGLSMVGGNSVVYLDEPTAGLDPVSRRQLWELVERNRKGRAILLTTHFMDEADVLGDRIAVVKQGRLRALGTSKYLKKRFGMGYLLRMSLAGGLPAESVEQIMKQVRAHIDEATIASHAGTELSVRLPRDAITAFADLFEVLERDSKALGINSYGIETTTLEEVFMRIVNEDDGQLLEDHDAANKMLGASAEERDAMHAALAKQDDKMNPIDEGQMAALLIKGQHRGGYSDDGFLGPLISQVLGMVQKRYYQFARSKGQVNLGIVIPCALAVLIGLLLASIPTKLLAPNEAPITSVYGNTFPTLLAGANQTLVESYIEQGFGAISTTYVGENYTALFNVVNDAASTLQGPASTTGIVLDGVNNFTVMYNASYPGNFAASVQQMLETAVSDATDNLLVLDQSFGMLPSNELVNQLRGGFFSGLLICLIAGSVGAGISIVVSGERVLQVKHQQLASGASPLAYWVGNFVFDFSLFIILVLLFTIIIAIIHPVSYTGAGFGYVFGAGFFYVIASIFRFYILSYAIEDVKLAQSIYFYGSLGLMFVFLNVWAQMLFDTAKGNAGDPVINQLNTIFTLLDPSFGFFGVIVYQNNFAGVITQNPGEDFLSYVAASYFNMLVVDAFMYGAIFVLISEGGLLYMLSSCWSCLCGCVGCGKKDTNAYASVNRSIPENATPIADLEAPATAITTKPGTKAPVTIPVRPAASKSVPSVRTPGQEDPDVASERDRVQSICESLPTTPLNTQTSAIYINNLRKVYYATGTVPAKVAVKEVNINIPLGEVFGLLGANGAGKTTLLKMVSGQEKPSSGFALVNGHDVVTDTVQAQRSMGLCPQFDTLVERLTVVENLLFFGQLKGLSKDLLPDVAEAFMKALNIKQYQNKLIQHLSGGNRRKVSLAVALIGAPPTVYLDEPSTGLDPVASRLMWRLLSRISATKTTAVVLTTHNMLECEAVCTRICIMKLGELVCLGDNQHLRSVHGTGFLLEASFKHPNLADGIKHFVVSTFAGAVVVDEQPTMLNFEIPRASIAHLSGAFRTMEQHKERLGVVDYALCQSTLEQVFLKQIRPNSKDLRNQEDQQRIQNRVPHCLDYFLGYFMWVFALFLPGLHHFYLGNFWRGVIYLFTINQLLTGWLLDLCEVHVLVQQSVQEYGNVGCCFCRGSAQGPTKDAEDDAAL